MINQFGYELKIKFWGESEKLEFELNKLEYITDHYLGNFKLFTPLDLYFFRQIKPPKVSLFARYNNAIAIGILVIGIGSLVVYPAYLYANMRDINPQENMEAALRRAKVAEEEPKDRYS